MKAKNRKHYIDCWQSHVNELIYPFLDSGAQLSEWEGVKAELMKVVEDAADKSFPTEEVST